MTLSNSSEPQRKKEDGSLGELENGDFARRVFSVSDEGSLLQGVTFDQFTGTETSSTVETYNYFLNSVLQATIVITYKDSNKDFVVDARRTL